MSLVLVNNALASLLKSNALFLAWGRGQTAWGTMTEFTGTLNGSGTLVLPNHPVDAVVVVKSGSPFTLYTEGTDYTVNKAAGSVSRISGGGISTGASLRVSYRIGSPAASPAATGLISEIGRRRITNKQFVVPVSSGGVVTVDGQAYNYSGSPTNRVLLDCTFDQADAPDEIIKEFGVFANVTLKTTVPSGQLYVLPSDILSAGILLGICNIGPIERTSVRQENFRVVLS